MSMNKRQIDRLFMAEYMPFIRIKEREYQGTNRTYKDIPMRCEEYNNFIDVLYKDGVITREKAEIYSIPSCLIS